MPFEEREHTADILMHVHAPDLPTLFADCGYALMAIMYRGRAGSECKRSFTVSGSGYEQLLQAFLSELLWLTETENLVFSEISVRIGEDSLSAELSGEPFDWKQHGGGTEVKGVSFFGLAIKEQNGIFELDILFDV